MKKNPGQNSPFILYPKKDIAEVRECVLENYGQIKYELPFLNALCVEIPQEKIQTIRTNQRIAVMSEDIAVSKLPVYSEESQLKGRSSLPPMPNFPGETQGRYKAGRDHGKHSKYGAGVSIAIIDTGVCPHYDLTRPFNRILKFRDFVNGKTFPYDDDGHGTHVAGVAAGNGYSSRGRYTGTAPMSALVCLKALDHAGNGKASDILAAMQWIYDHHEEYHIRVVNLSLGTSPPVGTSSIDPLELGANILALSGLSVVAAAGNGGPDKRTITSPGTSPMVLTVGAADQSNHVASFSSRGPVYGGIMKPDVVAPGVDIVSLSWKNCRGYLSQSGTSMAAPYISGLAADLYSRYPNASSTEIKRILLRHANPISHEPISAQGYGLLKVTDPAVESLLGIL